MWTLNHFNESFNCNGTIAQAIATNPNLQNSVGNQVPYIDGQQADMQQAPRAGATVTFRPRMSGKAR